MQSTQTEKGQWRSEDLGKIQAGRLNKILRSLHSERHSHTRLSGVAGVQEDSCTVFTYGGGPVNEAAVAAWDALGERFGWSVSKATLKDVTAAAEAAIAEAQAGRPVVDERRTPAADAEIRRAQAERNAEEFARQAKVKASHAAILAKRPAGAEALVLAELDEDKCDSQTDYFAHDTVRAVAIGWRFGKREDFAQLRAAAASFPETAHLGPDAPKEVEHRDNYSMGSGNYLKDGYTHRSGWRVRSVDLKWRDGLGWREVEDRLPAASAAAEAGEAREAGGAAVADSAQNPANVEVRFEAKPDEATRAELKAAGFRWSPRSGCWYGRRERLPARYAQEATA